MRIGDEVGAARALLLTRLLRAGILFACGVTLLVAWARGATTVAALAVVIALEETWETSVVVAALRRQLRGAGVPRHRSERT